MRGLLIILACTLLAGCAEPGIVTWERPGASWTEAEGPWMILTRGCGLCDGGADYPETTTTVLYRDGKVLWFSSAQPVWVSATTSYDDGVGPLQDELESAMRMSTAGYHDDPVRVFEAHATSVPPDAWPALRSRLSAWHGQLAPTGPPQYDCEDCSAPIIEAFDPDIVAALWGNYDEGTPWAMTLEQMRFIQRQAEPPR